jgi:glutaredoxin-like protein NrdH
MNVKVYALSTCPYCRMARKYLDESGVEYDVVEVDLLGGDDKQRTIDEVREVSGGASFPVIRVGDEVIVGFNKARMKELLEL